MSVEEYKETWFQNPTYSSPSLSRYHSNQSR